MRSHAVVISNKSYRTTRKLNWEPQDIAMICIDWGQTSQIPLEHWIRHLESGTHLNLTELHHLPILYQRTLMLPNEDWMENAWVWAGPSGVLCGDSTREARGACDHTLVTWHVTMLPSRDLINGCQYPGSASDQGWWWHEDLNCLMHSSLEMHWTFGNNDWNSSRIWSPQLIHWSCSHSPLSTPGHRAHRKLLTWSVVPEPELDSSILLLLSYEQSRLRCQ